MTEANTAASSNGLIFTDRFQASCVPDGSITADGNVVAVAGRKNDGLGRADATVGTDGIAIVGDSSLAKAGYVGVAIAGAGGTAICGPSGAAIADDGGTAIGEDGSVAFVRAYRGTATAAKYGATAICAHNGTATVDDTGFASVEMGKATGGDWALASIREQADHLEVGKGGIAVGWCRTRDNVASSDGQTTLKPRDDLADQTQLKAISAGEGGLIIAFVMDANGHRQPVVGFVGDVAVRAQGGLCAGQSYRLDEHGTFVPA